MKGIKTAVKTDWKNYAHGNTRGPIGVGDWYATGLKQGDVAYLSYHVEWKGVKGEKAFSTTGLFQFGPNYDYQWAGPYIESADGSLDVVSKIVLNTHFGTSDPVAETDKCSIYMHGEDWGISIEEGGYVKLTNIMLSKDKPMPYIDSDELKAVGGAISRALIVALHLSEERRVA
jgi:hypothetical protein|nr:MAG TPA: hypothetical protein [Caudoviricetes sp.]